MRLTTFILFILTASLSFSCNEELITPSPPRKEWTLTTYVIQRTYCLFSLDNVEDTVPELRPVLIEELLLLNDPADTDLILRLENGRFEIIKHGRLIMIGTYLTTENEIVLTYGPENVPFTIVEQSDNKMVLHNDTVQLEFGSDIIITFTRP